MNVHDDTGTLIAALLDMLRVDNSPMARQANEERIPT